MHWLCTICLMLPLYAVSTHEKEASHWAFQKPERVEPPTVKQTEWPRNAIDQFVLAKLEEVNLRPSPEAVKITLLRRVHLDLIGLPPSIEEVKAFVNNDKPNAYELVVDNLLASQHYGERWGRHWLDAARYADSDGYSHDAPRTMWQYRDWVIKATNDDLPFDQFVIEQLAGDMLPKATTAQRIATGFHRNTQINTEGGVDREQFRVDSIFDRIGTTGEVLFGLTFGCAQCHDHKYDPVKQVEFYRMFAFYNQADEPKAEIPTDRETAERSAHDLKVKVLSEKVDAAEKGTEVRKIFEAELAKLKKSRARATTALVMAQRKTSRITHRFIQGNFTRPAEEVKPGVPEVLHCFPMAEKADRLGFARWIANNCLLARRLVERGVRFVQLYHANWDHHGGPTETLTKHLTEVTRQIDQPCAALIKDLKSRGLLDDTLVIWGGEFGRTPMSEKRDTPGRNHHIDAFCMWFAGGGVKAGHIVGETDEFGFGAVKDECHVHDLHATIMHLLGMDHEKLTFRFQGRDFRLTDVEGRVIDDLCA